MLLLVVVVVTISALVGGAAATSAATERGATSAARELAQARALAWSGVQAAMAELAEQRETLLGGEAPVLTESWELFADSSGRRGVVRLVDLTPEDDGVAIPEAGRLCVNTATRQMLVDLGIDDSLAGRILDERSKGEFGSVEGLLRVPGVTASMLGHAGGADESDGGSSQTGTARVEGPVGGAGGAMGEAAGSELASLLTAFSFDPNIQRGVGDGGEAFRGRQRVNLDQPWSQRLGGALIERFGQDAADGVERIMRDGTTFRTDRDIVATLRRLQLPPETWGDVLDVFTTSDDEYLIGRVDLGSAPEAVLAALPGINQEQAREIVAARGRLGTEAMGSTTWLVTEGILTEDNFEEVVDHVTTRCMQWRVRVEAGMTDAAAEESGVGGPVGGGGSDDGARVRPRVVLEAVIDVSSQRARVAYLRDVSLMEAALAVLGDPGLADELGLLLSQEPEEPEELDGAEVNQPTEEDDAEGVEAPAASGRGGRLAPAPEAPGGETSANPEFDGPSGEGAGALEGAGDGGSEFKDRRIGRWTTGRNRGGSTQGGGW